MHWHCGIPVRIPSELSLLLAAHLYLEKLLLKSIANKVLLFFFLFCLLWFCFVLFLHCRFRAVIGEPRRQECVDHSCQLT